MEARAVTATLASNGNDPQRHGQMIFFRCTECQTKLKVKPERVGQRFRCPSCGAVLAVPAPDSAGTGPSDAVYLGGSQSPVTPPPVDVASPSLEAAIPWDRGTVLLDDFVVQQRLGAGGMGDVFLVQSRFTGEPFAIKRILPRLVADVRYRKVFQGELRTWIDLPEHPHLTACRFFRTLEEQVVIFAEYVNGGNLDKWIRDKRLTSIEYILDVAIQVAWGLYSAHEQGLVHQDVKPANVLMSEDLLSEDFRHAKITDFGLAKARAAIQAEMRDVASSDGARPNVKRKTGAGTAAYCSPEQAAGDPVYPPTDLWGWALCIVEMLLGKRTWEWGPTAPQVLESGVQGTREGKKVFQVAPPETLLEMLRRCFRPTPTDRFANLREAADAAIGIYEKEVGRAYPRTCPKVASKPATAKTFARRSSHGAAWSDPAVWAKETARLMGGGVDPADWLMEPRPGSRHARAIDDLFAYEQVYGIYSRHVAEGHAELKPRLALSPSKRPWSTRLPETSLAPWSTWIVPSPSMSP